MIIDKADCNNPFKVVALLNYYLTKNQWDKYTPIHQIYFHCGSDELDFYVNCFKDRHGQSWAHEYVVKRGDNIFYTGPNKEDAKMVFSLVK